MARKWVNELGHLGVGRSIKLRGEEWVDYGGLALAQQKNIF